MVENSSFAQKYRPLLFKEVIDQENIVKVLKNIIKNKKYSSPLMFTGIYGGGKTSLARVTARAILCENLQEDQEPCNKCPSCVAFLEGNHLAYVEIDAASNSGVDSIRKLREDANFKVLGNYKKKVVVIDECHSISKQGNEALLKQLEDNTSNQIYIFCTTSPEDMHETVRSRCFEFELNKNTKEAISIKLKEICKKEVIVYEDAAIDVIADMCSPHVRDSIKNLDYLSNFGGITLDVVSNYFNLYLDNDFLRILLSLKESPTDSLNIANKISLKTSIFSIYEGLIETILKVLKLKLNISCFKNKDAEEIGKQLIQKYNSSLFAVLEELLKRNRYVDKLTLESDLLLLSQKLNFGFVNKELICAAPTEEKITEIKEKSVEDPQNEEEQTSQVLKRYKSYPPSVAMMLDKSKKSSTLNKNLIVESNIKDYIQALPKKDIKSFIEDKIKNETLGNFSTK